MLAPTTDTFFAPFSRRYRTAANTSKGDPKSDRADCGPSVDRPNPRRSMANARNPAFINTSACFSQLPFSNRPPWASTTARSPVP
jgi:hypothetical protein